MIDGVIVTGREKPLRMFRSRLCMSGTSTVTTKREIPTSLARRTISSTTTRYIFDHNAVIHTVDLKPHLRRDLNYLLKRGIGHAGHDIGNPRSSGSLCEDQVSIAPK